MLATILTLFALLFGIQMLAIARAVKREPQPDHSFRLTPAAAVNLRKCFL